MLKSGFVAADALASRELWDLDVSATTQKGAFGYAERILKET